MDTLFLKNMAEGPRIIIVTGHFGSGKTEFSVSLAFALAAMKREGALSDSLALCDLDVENPYFRSRELTEDMENEGIRVWNGSLCLGFFSVRSDTGSRSGILRYPLPD